jgi:hypothetical protein
VGFKTFTVGEVLTAADVNDYLMEQGVIVCTSGTRPASPHEGMFIYETDTNLYRTYTGAAWKRTGGQDVESASLFDNDSTTLSGFTNTTAAAGTPVVGDTFVCPPSGGVYITVSGYMVGLNDGQTVHLGWEVRQGAVVGSGTIDITTSVNRSITCGEAVNVGAPATLNASRRFLSTGILTPGSTYNVRTMHWVSGGSADIRYRELIVEPML